MQIIRSRERIIVDIPIVITTVLDSMEGSIVDLSEGGAQVVGCSVAPKTPCQLDFGGQIVFGTVRWSEIDRMGIRFPYELTDGPLFEQLEIARAAMRATAGLQARTARPFAGAMPQGGFGRRSV